MQPPFLQPWTAHVIRHFEFILVTDGTLEITLTAEPNGQRPAA
jgi:hypothetical protein